MVGHPGFKALLDFVGGLYEQRGTLFDIFRQDCQGFIRTYYGGIRLRGKKLLFYYKNGGGKTLFNCLAPAFHNRCFQQSVQ